MRFKQLEQETINQENHVETSGNNINDFEHSFLEFEKKLKDNSTQTNAKSSFQIQNTFNLFHPITHSIHSHFDNHHHMPILELLKLTHPLVLNSKISDSKMPNITNISSENFSLKYEPSTITRTQTNE